ncbi:MAG TPA: hypothetical protein VNK26_05690 [Pyrinomonadaceae bacterium]|nr:hypothetical protein [Pyrinomonadaceae bacterium]
MIRLFWTLALTIVLSPLCYTQSPKVIEQRLLGYLDTMQANGSYSGSYNEEKLNEATDKFISALLEAGRRADILRYSFPALKEKIFITTSPDGNFRIYSWDQETGGTMHDFLSLFQFRGRGGRVFARLERSREEDIPGSFYHDIFQLNTALGKIYLTVSTFIGSTSFQSQTIKAFSLNGNRLQSDLKIFKTSGGIKNNISFAYDFFSVVDRPERPVRLFSFNAAKKEFSFPVVIEDEKTPQGRVTDKRITYRYNGRYFVRSN